MALKGALSSLRFQQAQETKEKYRKSNCATWFPNTFPPFNGYSNCLSVICVILKKQITQTKYIMHTKYWARLVLHEMMISSFSSSFSAQDNFSIYCLGWRTIALDEQQNWPVGRLTHISHGSFPSLWQGKNRKIIKQTVLLLAPLPVTFFQF